MPPCCRALCEDTTVEKQILILLAAYKGGRFIRPMVDSILAQDVGGWRLILSDDGEDTAPILQEYADKYPDKITHYRSGRRFGSAQKHFMHLLEQFGGQADCIMFSDQDDVWHPDKVRLTLRLMEQAETDCRCWSTRTCGWWTASCMRWTPPSSTIPAWTAIVWRWSSCWCRMWSPAAP